METVMESVRDFLHGVAVFLATLLDPVIGVLRTGGTALRRFLDSMNIPPIAQPVVVFACWLLAILVLIRFLRGLVRLLALAFVALLLLRIYGVLPDF